MQVLLVALSASLLVGPFLRFPSAEPPAGFVRFAGLDRPRKIRISGRSGFLRQRAEPSQFALMECTVLPQRGQTPNH